MPQIRNIANLDLMDRRGVVYPAGQAVDVDDATAARILTNPNFQRVEPAPPDPTERPRRAGKKD